VLALQQSETYKRHRPETTLLYQLIERYYPEFTYNLAEQGKYLPKYVELEFDEFLRCGQLEHGFLRVVCGDCKHEKLVAFSRKRRGFCPSCGARTHHCVRHLMNNTETISLFNEASILGRRLRCKSKEKRY
jgi:ribosomal protein S27E